MTTKDPLIHYKIKDLRIHQVFIIKVIRDLHFIINRKLSYLINLIWNKANWCKTIKEAPKTQLNNQNNQLNILCQTVRQKQITVFIITLGIEMGKLCFQKLKVWINTHTTTKNMILNQLHTQKLTQMASKILQWPNEPGSILEPKTIRKATSVQK